jgi:hypothetical protein
MRLGPGNRTDPEPPAKGLATPPGRHSVESARYAGFRESQDA